MENPLSPLITETTTETKTSGPEKAKVGDVFVTTEGPLGVTVTVVKVTITTSVKDDINKDQREKLIARLKELDD